MGWMGLWAVIILALRVKGEGDMVTSNQINIMSKDLENTTFETLPTAQEWRNAPSCPLWGPMDSFYKEGIEKGQYLGRWWLQDKHSELADLNGKCWSQTYSVDYINKTIYRDNEFQTYVGSFPRTDSGKVTIEDIRDSNLLTFTPEEAFLSSPPAEYRVLATDYQTFTIEYSCKDTNLIRRNERIWIYTRDKVPPRSVLKRAYKSLKVLGLSGWKLKKADQSCEEVPKVMPVRRTFEVTATTSTTTQRPFMRIGTPSISTGQLTAKMLGSSLQLAQKVLAPWTLHPQLGMGMGKKGNNRRVVGGMEQLRRRSGGGGRTRGRRKSDVLRRKTFRNKKKRNRNYNYY